MADQPWHELPPEIADGPAAGARRRRRRDDRGGRARSRPTRGRSRGRSARGSGPACRRRCATSWPRSRPGGPVAAPRRVLGARAAARCAPGAASSRCSAPTGSAPGWRGGGSPPPGVAAGLEPDTLYLLAESIFAYIDVLSAESAEGYALEQSAAASEAELRRRRLVRMLVREPPADPEAVEAAADDAGWPLPRTLAVRGDRRRAARRRGVPAARRRDQRGDRRAHLRARPRPRRPRAAGGDRAGGGRRRGARRGWGRPSTGPQAPVSFARARGGARAGRRAGRRWSAARERAGELLLRSDPRLAARARRRPAGAAGRAVAGLAAAADRDAAGVAGRAGAARARSPSGSGSTPRPRATGWRGCASCSATRWTTPTRASGSSWRCGSRRAAAEAATERRPVGWPAQAAALRRSGCGLGLGLGSPGPRGRARRRRSRRPRRR